MNLRLHRLSMDCPWRIPKLARPAGLEPATPGLEVAFCDSRVAMLGIARRRGHRILSTNPGLN